MKKFAVIAVIFLCLGCASPIMTREQMMQEAKYDHEDSPFGVLEFLHWSHDWNDFKYPDETAVHKSINMMQATGVKWVRFDFLWQDIEPTQGEFNFERYDRIVGLAAAHHINILGILDYTVNWASEAGGWNCAPRDNKCFVNYARQVVSRYKDKIKYWEVWNEPDSPIYWQPQDGLKSYCQLLKETYIAAKEIDPDCKILNGGLAHGPSSVNKLYEAGAKDYFDILNIHIFESPINPGSAKRMQAYPKMTYKIMKR
ncbi:MAG: endo-1,4-beta-xylanase, partial [Candidatus Omnitrophica bacterium]|nr:endo-1,4-beta-xylanase [Candidatus Omnitrophota bacterium]